MYVYVHVYVDVHCTHQAHTYIFIHTYTIKLPDSQPVMK